MKLKEHFQQVVDSGKGYWITDFIMYYPKDVQEKIKKVFPSHLKYLTCVKLKRIKCTKIFVMKLNLKEKVQSFIDSGKTCLITDFLDYFPRNIRNRLVKINPENLRWYYISDLIYYKAQDQILSELLINGFNWGTDEKNNPHKEEWIEVYRKIRIVEEHSFPIKYLI